MYTQRDMMHYALTGQKPFNIHNVSSCNYGFFVFLHSRKPHKISKFFFYLHPKFIKATCSKAHVNIRAITPLN